jgi:transaldolase / glucose-6-phosphate isomerase
MALNSFSYQLPDTIQDAVSEAAANWRLKSKIERVWAKDSSVWTGDDESKWLGWLDIVDEELSNVEQYRDFAADIRDAGFESVLLMGMGGSSLCPEVLAITFGKRHFHILDSTDPAQVKAVDSKLDLTKTLFIVASKSGSTLEPNCFKQYFFDRVSQISGEPGRQFVAITDPGSKMEEIAKSDGFRRIFYGKPEIGGRFSALSAFGLAAAASMGLEPEKLLSDAKTMVDACRDTDPEKNPGALLGLILGVCNTNGRDKLTILTSPALYDLGAWLEQLIAESTGKDGVAIIPVDREPLAGAAAYGNDRVFVSIALDGEEAPDVSKLADAGFPVINISLETSANLPQEFFRWEFATAVAGSVMGINPFNQSDVESAKIEARKITDEYEDKGELPPEDPFFTEDGASLFTSPDYADRIGGATLAEIISHHLSNISSGDYFALLAYVEMNEANQRLLQSFREKVFEARGVATCLGFGPRFLHSTGQAYKGGPNTGVFLQITSDDADDLPVPGQKYTFGVVKAAQARGDFQVLIDRDRRALRLHLSSIERLGILDELA